MSSSRRRDYYSILKLDRNATAEDIKRQYKALALQYHPDKNVGSDDEFKLISEAYQVLSDPLKRQEYDFESTSTSFPGHSNRDAFFSHSPFFFKSPSQVFQEFFGGRDPFDDPFFRSGSSSFFDRDPFEAHFDRFLSRDPFREDPFRDSFFSDSFSSSSQSQGGRVSSMSKSTSTRVVNGQRETITTIRDSQGNVTIEKTSQDPAGNITKTITRNGEPQGQPVSSRRIQIT